MIEFYKMAGRAACTTTMKRKLEILTAEESALVAQLRSLEFTQRDLRARLTALSSTVNRVKVDSLGPFSFFSWLPMEILFMIVEHVVKMNAPRFMCMSSFNLFLTCKEAYALKEACITHVYLCAGGGLVEGYMPPLPIVDAKRDSPWELLCCGIDPFVARDRGFYCNMEEWDRGFYNDHIHEWDNGGCNQYIHSSNIRLCPSELKCAAVTRVLLKFEGSPALDAAAVNGLVSTIPWEEWMDHVRSKFLQVFSVWWFWTPEGDVRRQTILALCEDQSTWRDAWTICRRRVVARQPGQTYTLLRAIQPGWEIPIFSYDEDDVHIIVFNAPDFVLADPTVRAGLARDRDTVLRATILDWIYSQKIGRTRLHDLLLDNHAPYTIDFYEFFDTPALAVGFEQYMHARGASIEWRNHYLRREISEIMSE